MSKKINSVLLILAVISLMLFSACNNSETPKVQIETVLAVDSSFSGSRTILCNFPQEVIPKNSEKETNLDKIVQKYCPDSMNYTKNTVDDHIAYSFQLKFNSSTDYTDKVSDIIGSQATVSFSNPDTVLTNGWKIEENFQSSQLIEWIYDGAKAESFSDMDFSVEEIKTTVSLNDDIKESEPIISVNNLSGYPIQKISIETVNKKNSVYDRTFIFTISQTTFDELGDNLTEYFRNATDNSASSADWLLENNSYLYTVKFTDVTLKQLEGYTNNLLGSVYSDIRYEDKSTGSTPLAEQNLFCETLDFSNYVGNGNGNVPIEYTYSVEGSTELGECMLYENDSWTPATNFLDTNQYGKKLAIKSSSSLLNLQISDGKQYEASAIDITVTPLENDTISKTITFRYNITTGGNESSDYTKSYFDSLNIGAVQSVNGTENTCSITFSGNDTELNSIIPTIFGSRNLISYSQYTPSMTLRTVKQFSDHIDLSDILVGKNSDTPVNYYVVAQNGDIVKSLSSVTTGNSENSETSDIQSSSSLEQDENGAVAIRLNGCENDVSFDVSVADTPSIVTFCIIAFIITALTIGIILYLRTKKAYTSLPESDKQKIFSNKNNKLAKREKEEKK